MAPSSYARVGAGPTAIARPAFVQLLPIARRAATAPTAFAAPALAHEPTQCSTHVPAGARAALAARLAPPIPRQRRGGVGSGGHRVDDGRLERTDRRLAHRDCKQCDCNQHPVVLYEGEEDGVAGVRRRGGHPRARPHG